MTSSAQSSTLTEYIDNIRNESITMHGIHLQEMIGDDNTKIIINDVSILRKYWPEIVASSEYIILDNREKMKYFYKPWLFCYDTYGNEELWFELLKLNQIRSFSEFNHETFRVFSSDIIRKIKAILDLEEQVIDINVDEMLKLKKEAATT